MWAIFDWIATYTSALMLITVYVPISLVLTIWNLLPPYVALILKHKICTYPYLRTAYKVYKCLYGAITGSTELLRVCRVEGAVGTQIIVRVESSLAYSTELELERAQIERADGTLDAVHKIILLRKRFPQNASTETPEAHRLLQCLTQMNATHVLAAELVSKASIKVDHKKHRLLLQSLWESTFPEDPYPKDGKSDLWVKMGFQWKDPTTDFRAVGLLALGDLEYLATRYKDLWEYIFKCASHPVSWYCPALTGIVITQFLLQSVLTRRVQYYFYRTSPTLSSYRELYVYLYEAFNEHWTSYNNDSPPTHPESDDHDTSEDAEGEKQSHITIMDFERVFEIFKKRMVRKWMGYRQLEIKAVPAIANKSD